MECEILLLYFEYLQLSSGFRKDEQIAKVFRYSENCAVFGDYAVS